MTSFSGSEIPAYDPLKYRLLRDGTLEERPTGGSEDYKPGKPGKGK